jgi:predicted Zn-dependent protease
VLSVCLLGIPVHGHAQRALQLPDFGDSSSTVLSATEENKLGEAFLREIRANADMLDDPEVDGYISRLGYKLASASNQPSQSFTFFVVADSLVNAFAGPGGVIGINSGLLLAVDTESELAAVMAHEIAHVTQRHIARAFERADNFSIPALAGLLAAIVLGSQNSRAGSVAAAALVGGQAQAQLDFIRSNEREADRVGIETLINAGFDPRSMASFFERLQEAGRYYKVPPEFLSTHPVTSSRIADGRARADRYSYRQYEDSGAFHRVRARLKIRSLGPKKALVEFANAAKVNSGALVVASRYGSALALLELERYQEAKEILERLRSTSPDTLPFQAALARALAGQKQYTRAVRIYEQALEVYLNERQMTFGLADTWLVSGRPDRAVKVLSGYVRDQPTDALAYRLLARSHERAGSVGQARAALAEHYYLNGNLGQAVFQLEKAVLVQDLNYYQSARIAARLQTLRREREERDAG